MATTNSARAAASNTSPDAASTLREKIRAHLEHRRDELCREIGDYPPPRPACDVDFNKLLEERALMFQELARLDGLLGEDHSRERLAASLTEIIRTSSMIDENARSERVRQHAGCGMIKCNQSAKFYLYRYE